LTDATRAAGGGLLVRVVLLATVIGAIDGVVFLVFEWIVKDGTDWLWNDLFETDVYRWRVVIVATALSIGFSVVLRLIREPRWVEPHTDPLAEGEETTSASLADLGSIFVVGATGLVAGAALGPEAPLVALSAGVGLWLAGRGRVGPATRVLTLASVGALLVAFIGSLLAIGIPLLLLLRKGVRSLRVAAVLPIVIAGVVAYLVEWAIRGQGEGFGTLPAGTEADLVDYVAGVVVGLGTVILALGLRQAIVASKGVTREIDRRLAWPVSAAVFGVVLGLLYLVGGESVQFSGSEGTGMLLEQAPTYSAVALLGLIVVKLAASSWSLSAGYRGGLVFPSIYAAVALGEFAAHVDSGLAGPGVILGAVAGILTAMGGPVLAMVMLVALIPASLLGVAVAGSAGAVIGTRAVKALGRRRGQEG
jgi:H+/Cl- antiporter ClcA